MLLLVGTEEGCVSMRDMRKGAGHGNVTLVHSAEVSSLGECVVYFLLKMKVCDWKGMYACGQKAIYCSVNGTLPHLSPSP